MAKYNGSHSKEYSSSKHDSYCEPSMYKGWVKEQNRMQPTYCEPGPVGGGLKGPHRNTQPGPAGGK